MDCMTAAQKVRFRGRRDHGDFEKRGYKAPTFWRIAADAVGECWSEAGKFSDADADAAHRS
jgi:hypothetical protein